MHPQHELPSLCGQVDISTGSSLLSDNRLFRERKSQMTTVRRSFHSMHDREQRASMRSGERDSIMVSNSRLGQKLRTLVMIHIKQNFEPN